MTQTTSLHSPTSLAPSDTPDHSVSFVKACRCGERLEAQGHSPVVAAQLIAYWDSRHRGEGHESARARVGGTTGMTV